MLRRIILLGVLVALPAAVPRAGLAACAGLDTSCLGWWAATESNTDDFLDKIPTVSAAVAYPISGGGIRDPYIIIGANDGTGGINLGDPASLAFTSSFTIETWLKFGGGQYPLFPIGMIFHRGDDRQGFDPYYFGVTNTGRLVFHIENGSEIAEILSPASLALSQWYHVAAVFSSNTFINQQSLRIYVDGVSVANTSVTGIKPFAALDASKPHGVCIGNVGGTPTSVTHAALRGSIDELSVYNKALTTAQILAIYNAGAEAKCDKTPPVIDTVAVGPPFVSPQDTVTVTVTAHDNFPGSFVIGVTANGITIPQSNTPPYPWTGPIPTDFHPGVHQVTVAVTDLNGNTATNTTGNYKTGLPFAANGKALRDPVMANAENNYIFIAFGKATVVTPDEFNLTDSSGVSTRVICIAHGLATGNYASARGQLFSSASQATITCANTAVTKY